ncbi:MAG: DUF4854 domain-containing protein [Eubacterium sp.]|nr:DUF4854 domain-containing protein [Eubacterium sp.]
MRNKKIFAILMIMVLAVSAFALTACGNKSKTLENFVESDKDLKAEIDKTAAENGLKIEIKDNTLTYLYKYEMEVSDEQVKVMAPQLEVALSAAENTFKGLAADLEKKTEIKGLKIAVVYMDKNEKVIYKTEFGSK